MQAIPQLLATAGWTSFSGIFSTVLPLLVTIAVLIWWYAVASRKHP